VNPDDALPPVPGATATLVPPCPNLGPEPLEPAGTPGLWWAVPAAVLALAALAIARRVVASKVFRTRGAGGKAAGGSEETPGAGVVTLAETVRAALAARFGPAWRAKTTEEVANEAGIAEAFGPEAAGRVVALLRAADLQKFAPSGPEGIGGHGTDVADWSEFVAGFVAAAGARSTITGR